MDKEGDEQEAALGVWFIAARVIAGTKKHEEAMLVHSTDPDKAWTYAKKELRASNPDATSIFIFDMKRVD